METVSNVADVAPPESADGAADMSLSEFIGAFGSDLLSAVRRQNPPIYSGDPDPARDAAMSALLRQPFPAQRNVVQALMRLLVDHDEPAAIINAEMGTGKTMMGIAAATLMHQSGFHRTLIICPPHLVYKWRREIRDTVPGARVWVLNGPDTLKKLLQLRGMLDKPVVPEFFVLGRVRMRMGFNWIPAFNTRKVLVGDDLAKYIQSYPSCPRCGELLLDEDGNAAPASWFQTLRRSCPKCQERLWRLVAKTGAAKSRKALLLEAMTKIPTIGPKTAQRLLQRFGEEMLSSMLGDNVFEFINLMDDSGEFVFSDRQSRRMERAMATMEFSVGQGGYQPTEFIKRYLPQDYFGLLLVDEGHEYKNEGSAQGQAMGVLARKCAKVVALTGTLMGGYADDLFHLLFRLKPQMMIEDGYGYNARKSLGPAVMSFMRDHGILKDVYKESDSTSHRTARAKAVTHRTSKGPGFGPKGIMRYVAPITAFLKLKDLGGAVLPPYREHFTDVTMTDEQAAAYSRLSMALTSELREALRRGDTTLLGVVLNALLAWPECAFRDEYVRHPRKGHCIAFVPKLFGDNDPMPKEQALLDLCVAEKRRGRRVLVYTIYSGTRDTGSRLQGFLARSGFRASVLRASVNASKREDWLFEQVDRGVDVVITNPELVKTGLDMLEFPTIVFMQSGFNVYTLQQAARRSWRIGQKNDVDVHFFGYRDTTQIVCLELMAKKIAVSQSTSGDMPESGLDVLNQGGDSIEVELAKRLLS
jgi:hypothetical protein